MCKRLLLIVGLFVLGSMTSYAQSGNKRVDPNSSSIYHYYMYIDGVNTKDDVIFIETTVQKMTGVSYFLTNRFPSRYFLLKSNHSVDAADVAKLIGTKYKILYYRAGEEAREGAILMFYKLHPGSN